MYIYNFFVTTLCHLYASYPLPKTGLRTEERSS